MKIAFITQTFSVNAVRSTFSHLMVGGLLFGGVTVAGATVVAPSAYTASGYNLTSLTISGTTYSTLLGSTASVVNQTGVTLGCYVNGTSPVLLAGDASAAVSGLDFRTGAGNINVGSAFQFGQPLSVADRIFVSDLGVGDAVVLNVIDGAGATIGDYALSLSASSFGSLIAPATYRLINNTTGADGGTVSFVNSFLSFQLADFSGTFGDLSTATGIRLAVGTGWDPSMVGLVASSVPEPSALALGSLGLAGILFQRCCSKRNPRK